MHIDDALEYIVKYLKEARKDQSYQGYEIGIPNIVHLYLEESGDWSPTLRFVDDHPKNRELSQVFFEAAWELCRRGVLRPSVQFFRGGQGASDGSGYTTTKLGRRWIEQRSEEVLIGGPDRISELFARFTTRYGPAFLQRATEAAHCHAFGVYLACCAMCGAAAESILLAVAVAKTGNEASVLASYRTAGGRQRVINRVAGQSTPAIATSFRTATSLLSYWRDDAAHGLASTISEIEAHDALARLLRFAQFTTDQWAELTRQNP